MQGLGKQDKLAKKEITVTEAYARGRYDVDIEPGAIWNDLGNHIGLFTLYAIGKGAVRGYCDAADPHNVPLLSERPLRRGARLMHMPAARLCSQKAAGAVTVYRPTDPENTWR